MNEYHYGVLVESKYSSTHSYRRLFYPRGKSPLNREVDGWRAGLDGIQKRESLLSLPEFEPRTSGCPALGLVIMFRERSLRFCGFVGL
jgi:hypothetical protein